MPKARMLPLFPTHGELEALEPSLRRVVAVW